MIIHRVDVPYNAPEKPTVYVVVGGKWTAGDVAGVLMLPDGEVAWQHISSSINWLINDLTISFADRREQLTARCGPELDVAVVEDWGNAPSWLRELNAQAAG